MGYEQPPIQWRQIRPSTRLELPWKDGAGQRNGPCFCLLGQVCLSEAAITQVALANSCPELRTVQVHSRPLLWDEPRHEWNQHWEQRRVQDPVEGPRQNVVACCTPGRFGRYSYLCSAVDCVSAQEHGDACDQRQIRKWFQSRGVDGDADASTDAHGTKHATYQQHQQEEERPWKRVADRKWDATRPAVDVSQVPPDT